MNRNGYIALTSVILVTAGFLFVLGTMSVASIFGRLDVGNFEFRERSRALSEACVNVARLRLVQDSGYTGDETVTIGSSTCQIFTVTVTGPDRLVPTQGIYQDSYTNLETTISADGLVFIGANEVAEF